jgi:hypothetical protein
LKEWKSGWRGLSFALVIKSSRGFVEMAGFLRGWIENLEMAEGFGSPMGRNVEMAEDLREN